MSSPRYYDDGSFNVAQQNGPWRYSFPFAERGDRFTFIAQRMMRCAAIALRPSVLMTQINSSLGRAYLVNVSESKDVGGGLLEWEETWASLPQTRSEYGSITYTLQDLTKDASTPPQFTLREFTSTRDARVVYEYSITAPLPRQLAPMVILVNNRAYGFGGWGTFYAGQEILAQDTQSQIYMCRIYERKSVLIEYQPFVQLV